MDLFVIPHCTTQLASMYEYEHAHVYMRLANAGSYGIRFVVVHVSVVEHIMFSTNIMWLMFVISLPMSRKIVVR